MAHALDHRSEPQNRLQRARSRFQPLAALSAVVSSAEAMADGSSLSSASRAAWSTPPISASTRPATMSASEKARRTFSFPNAYTTPTTASTEEKKSPPIVKATSSCQKPAPVEDAPRTAAAPSTAEHTTGGDREHDSGSARLPWPADDWSAARGSECGSEKHLA
eukprot:scaffold23160_cov107-Isochrysis_galbana.AAC.3